MSDKKQDTKLIEVTLAKRHTHADVDYEAGARIQVDEPTAKWLADNQVIHTTAPTAQKEGAK